MADTKISALTALAGSSVDTAADVIPIVDTGATTTKKIVVDELAIAMGVVPATQSQMEAGTATTATVTPGRQHYHPSAAKAWGILTPATTITASYPAAGVSATNPSTGKYVITHGLTFSSSNYTVLLTVAYSGFRSAYITAQDATTFTVQIDNGGGPDANFTRFHYACFGDI